MEDKKINRRFISPEEASAISGYTVGTLADSRCKKRGCPYYKRGRKVFYDREEFENWLTENRVLTKDAVKK